MKKSALIFASVAVAGLFAGCVGDVKFSDLFDDSARGEGTGIQGSSLIRAVVILAKHDASAKQRAVAEQNGRRAVARMQTQISRPPAKPHEREKPVVSVKPHKKLPRVIAIATEKDSQTDKKAAKAIMLFDTRSQQIIGNKVYDIESEPRAGEEVRFETQAASYLGASL